MFDSRVVGILVLALPFLLAGCSAPTDQTPAADRNISVTVMNDADRPYAVRITLVSGEFDALSVTFRNGSTRRLAVSAVAEVPPGTLTNATDFRIIGSNTQTRRFTLTPGTGTGTTYEDVPENTSVVYHLVSSDEAAANSWGVLQCRDSAMTDVRISINSDHTYDIANACSDWEDTTGD